MKTLITIGVLLICLNCFSQEDLNVQLKNEIERLEHEHAQAILKGDAKALDTLMSDEVTVNHPTNRIVNEKQELFNMINKGIIRYASFERTPEKYMYFPDMVVVMGHEVVMPAKGAPNSGNNIKRRYTNIWMKENGKWVLRIRHGNNVCD